MLYTQDMLREVHDKKWKVTSYGHRAHKHEPDEWADEPNASWPWL